MNTHQCPTCGDECTYKEGFSKEKNKPWAGWFCQNDSCKKVDWIRVGVQKTLDKTKYQSQPNEMDVLSEGINNIHKIVMEIYKLDVALYKEVIKNKLTYGKTDDDRPNKGSAPSESGE